MRGMLELKIDVLDHFTIDFHRPLRNQAPRFSGRLCKTQIDHEPTNPNWFRCRKMLSDQARRSFLLKSRLEIFSRHVGRSRAVKAPNNLFAEGFLRFHRVKRALLDLRSERLNLFEIL